MNNTGTEWAALAADGDGELDSMDLILVITRLTAEHDAERAARERAEAEARQLREQIRLMRGCLRCHGAGGWQNSGQGFWENCPECAGTGRAAAVAEGAEDRGQTDDKS